MGESFAPLVEPYAEFYLRIRTSQCRIDFAFFRNKVICSGAGCGVRLHLTQAAGMSACSIASRGLTTFSRAWTATRPRIRISNISCCIVCTQNEIERSKSGPNRAMVISTKTSCAQNRKLAWQSILATERFCWWSMICGVGKSKILIYIPGLSVQCAPHSSAGGTTQNLYHLN